MTLGTFLAHTDSSPSFAAVSTCTLALINWCSSKTSGAESGRIFNEAVNKNKTSQFLSFSEGADRPTPERRAKEMARRGF